MSFIPEPVVDVDALRSWIDEHRELGEDWQDTKHRRLWDGVCDVLAKWDMGDTT